MRLTYFLSAVVLLSFFACETDEDCEPEALAQSTSLVFNVSATAGGDDIGLYERFINVNGDSMFFEELRMYIGDISLIKIDGSLEPISEVEYFDFEGEPHQRSYSPAAGDYQGLVYHVGVPTRLNGTDNPDFLTSQYGPESPLNVQNGMHWSWQDGYRFIIYEGKVDTTPQITTDFPASFAIHLGKDTLYTEIEVNTPFSINEGGTTRVDIDWDLAKSIYSETDTLQLGRPTESLFHGVNLDLGFRYQAMMKNAITTTIE